jgi:acyl-[acyl-carrier-protein]-phospholipid O-acyltransferase / long-chain-fatty-acid--[acyl-carrier-protein] ligase
MFKQFVRLVLRLLYRLEVRGSLMPAPRTLVVANHQSFLDAALLWAYLPDHTLWVVHAEVMKQWLFRLLVQVADYITIDTRNPYALKAVIEVVEAGRPVVIFPEGRVTVTGTMMKMYDGPAWIAARTGATLVPVIIDGAVYAKGFTRMAGGNGFPLRWFPKIKVTFFPGLVVQMPEGRSGRVRRRKAGEELRRLLWQCWFEARPRRSLHDAFLDAAAFHGRRRRLVEDVTGVEHSYGSLLKGSLALGRLVSRFTAPGEVVGVLMPSASATLMLILGLFGLRRVPAMLNFTAGVEGVQSAIHTARIQTILTSHAFVERAKLGPLLERLERVTIVYLEDLRPRFTLRDKLWLILYALWAPRRVTLRTRPEDPAVILFTSGSEGKPKGVVLSHGSMLANIEQALTVMDVTSMDRILSAMPGFHAFGLTVGFLLPVVAGVRLYLYPSPLHYSIVPEAFYERDATIMFATPTFLKHYAARAHPYDFRRCRLLLAGAEKLTEDIRQVYMEKFGIRVLEGYGATECSPVIAVNTPMRAKSGTVGELLPGMEWRLEEVPGVDEGGLLHVRGPNLMLGYWRESAPGVTEPPSSSFGAGWYSTGDLAAIDDDGFLRLLGRVRRFAKIAGEMVSLETAERIAQTASPDAAHGAISRPDAGRGEMIVLATKDRSLKREHLQRAARDAGLPEIAIPRRIVHVEDIPLLGSGKRDYPKLARMVEEKLEQPQH